MTQPNAIGRRCAIRGLSDCVISQTEPGILVNGAERLEERRREALVDVARGEHEARDAVRMLRRDELAERAAGVVADERHALEPERVHEVDDHLRERRRREVGVRRQRRLVRPERPVGTMQRKSFDSRGTTLRQRLPLTRTPCTNSSGSPVPSSR